MLNCVIIVVSFSYGYHSDSLECTVVYIRSTFGISFLLIILVSIIEFLSGQLVATLYYFFLVEITIG